MHIKNRPLSLLAAEKIAFPPKSDIQTDIRTNISNYRVASLFPPKPDMQTDGHW